MGRKRLSNICKEILGNLQDKRRPDEEQTAILFDGIVDCIMEEDRELTADCRRVSDLLKRMRQYKDFDGLSAEDVFSLGGIWGSIRVSELYFERRNYLVETDRLCEVHRRNYRFFKEIHTNPGICHKDLAAKVRQSPSQLSQFVSRLTRDDLISCSRVGREKHYYLRKRGEQIYKVLEKERKHSAVQKAGGLHPALPQRIYGPREAADNNLFYSGQMQVLTAAPVPCNCYAEIVGNGEKAANVSAVIRRGGNGTLCQPIALQEKNMSNSF